MTMSWKQPCIRADLLTLLDRDNVLEDESIACTGVRKRRNLLV